MSWRRWTPWIPVVAGIWLAAPAASAACSSPIAVAVSTSGPSVLASLSNPTSHSISGYVGVRASLNDGSTGLASLPFNLPSHGTGSTGATFPVSIVGIAEIVVCDTPPWGISESPDPVIVVLPPPSDGGGNGNGNGGGGGGTD